MRDIVERLKQLLQYDYITQEMVDCFVNEATAEIERLRGLTEWQPIETAPKDGTQILLAGVCQAPSIDAGESSVVKGYWTDFNTGGWVWYGAAMDFTHWMPLPTPPERQDSD